jgi:hypothetical protein
MKDPPTSKIKLIDIEREENRLLEENRLSVVLGSLDSDNERECLGERCFTPPDESWEIIHRGDDFIIHGLENLGEQLDIIATQVDTENNTEGILKNIRKGLSIVDEIILYATTFKEEAIKAKVESFKGFTSYLREEAETNVKKTLIIVKKLRARGLLSLVPLTKDLIMEQNHIKKLASSSNLEQVKESLKEYRRIIRRRISRRYSI